jgi:hypothetical protein
MCAAHAYTPPLLHLCITRINTGENHLNMCCDSVKCGVARCELREKRWGLGAERVCGAGGWSHYALGLLIKPGGRTGLCCSCGGLCAGAGRLCGAARSAHARARGLGPHHTHASVLVVRLRKVRASEQV